MELDIKECSDEINKDELNYCLKNKIVKCLHIFQGPNTFRVNALVYKLSYKALIDSDADCYLIDKDLVKKIIKF